MVFLISVQCVSLIPIKKHFAKLLANRLKQHIGNVIHLDQTYCIPDRTIYDNLNLIRDIIHFSNSSNSPLAVVNLDQKT